MFIAIFAVLMAILSFGVAISLFREGAPILHVAAPFLFAFVCLALAWFAGVDSMDFGDDDDDREG